MAKQTFTTGQVLTAAQQNALNANDYNQTVSQKTASYVLVASDVGTRIEMNSASATTITINTGLFSAGDTLFLSNINSGACVVTAGTATVSKFSTASLTLSQYQGAYLYFVSTGVAILYSDSAGASTPLTTKGDLFGYDTANARIPIGTNNQVLTADSTASLGLKWATAASGGMTLLSTTTHSTASTTISVTPTGYNYLYILQTGFYNSGDTQKLRINADTGVFYNYIVQSWDGTAGTSTTAPTTSRGQKQSSLLLYNNGTDATYYATAVTIIYDPNNTGKDKVITNVSSGEDSATFTHNNYGSGVYLGSGALTSITLFGTSSQAGTVYIYGVK